MRTDWICHDEMSVVLRLLMPANALVMETCLVTGLRVSDVLQIPTAILYFKDMRVLEHKTGKIRTITLPDDLADRLRAQGGLFWLFESPRNKYKHRTRQAVWHDVKRAAKALRIKSVVAPHSARKIYAVQVYREQGLEAAQKALNHNSPATTLIYLLSELIRSDKR